MSKYKSAAQTVASLVPEVLGNRGLDRSVIKRNILVESTNGLAWLFVELQDIRLQKLERYIGRETLHQLSTALKGRPVILSNSNGLRYAVLLSEKPQLPSQVDYPGWRTGLVQIGVNAWGQPITASWNGLGHVLVAGRSGAGKSEFLRLIVAQALSESFALALCDPDGRTFPALTGHPALLAPIGTTFDGCKLALDAVWSEINRRRALLEAAPGNLPDIEAYNDRGAGDYIPRLVVVVDEYNGLVKATGGPKGAIGESAIRLAWQARKFNVTLCLAGQDFTRETTAQVSDQMLTRLCFAVNKPSTSRVIIGKDGGERIKQAGQALTIPWGKVQVYLADLQAAPGSDGLSQVERDLIEQLRTDYNGKMTEAALVELGYSQGKARAIRRDWLARGLAVVDPAQGNAAILADRALRGLRGLREGCGFVMENA